jgi:hypothetical protein
MKFILAPLSLKNAKEHFMNPENETFEPLVDTKWLASFLQNKVDTIEKNRCNYPNLLPPHYVIFGRTVRYRKEDVYEWLKKQ